MDMTLLIGIAGAAITLTAFILNEMERVTDRDKSYLLLNLAGSALLVFYALQLNSIPFIILNVVWALFAVSGLFRS